MLKNLNNLTQRIIVGLAGMAILLTGIIYGPVTYFIIFFGICLFSMLEYYKLTGLDGMLPLKYYGTASGLLIYTLSYFVAAGHLDIDWLIILFPVLTIIFFIKLYKKKDPRPFTNIAYTFLGIIYIAIPFSLLHLLAFKSSTYQFELILGILFLIWASDTGAYFAGVNFGRKKLFERISPKKSWEGFVGGTLLNMGVSVGLWYFLDLLPLWEWVLFGLLTAVTGTYGDLVESLFKRGIEIKDSGSLLPGHGGFLDRFDALIIAIPFVVPFILLLG